MSEGFKPPFSDPDFAREAGRKGGKATARKHQRDGVDLDALGSLDTHEDAKRWLALIGRAVVSKQLDARDAQAGVRSIEAWLKAEGERATHLVLEELQADVQRLKREIGGKPSVRRVS